MNLSEPNSSSATVLDSSLPSGSLPNESETDKLAWVFDSPCGKRALGKTEKLENLLHCLATFSTYDHAAGTLVSTRKRQSNSPKVGTPLGYLTPQGYWRVGINKQLYLVHRLVWLWHTGAWPVHELDHINGNTQDNRIENLRDVPHQVNMINGNKRSNNTSGHTGIYKAPNNKWKALVMINYVSRSLGHFNSKEEAIQARIKFLQKRQLYVQYP